MTTTSSGTMITLTAPFSAFSTANNALTSSDPRVTATTAISGASIKTTSPLILKNIQISNGTTTPIKVSSTTPTGIQIKGATGGFVRLSDWTRPLMGANVKLSSSTPTTVFPLSVLNMDKASLNVLSGDPTITITLTVA